MRLAVLLIGFAIVIHDPVLAQTSTPPKSSDDAQANLCQISGRVVAASDSTPLKSAHVVLIETDAGRNAKSYAATTDSNGAFTLKSVAPGRYRFFAAHNQYVSQQYNSHNTASGAILALQPKQQISNILFRLTAAAAITGRIVDEDNEPLSNVGVIALQKPSEDDEDDESIFQSKPQDLVPVASARTDDRGVYRIFGLKSGQYYLRASEATEPSQDYPSMEDMYLLKAVGREYAPVYFPGVLQRSQAEMVLLRPAEETQVDFPMRRIKTVEVSGRVLAADTKLANAFISLSDEDSQDHLDNQSASTDSEGRFKIRGVPPGKYIIRAYQPASDNVYRATAMQKIDVGNGNLDSVVLALGVGEKFTGRITVDAPSGPPPPHMYVSFTAIDDETMNLGNSARPDGTFELNAVTEGNYALNLHLGESGWFVESAHSGPDDILSHGLQVEKGGTGTIELVISKNGAQIEGTVVRDDKPAVAIRVRIRAEPETPYNHFRRASATTDQNGHFVINSVAPGTYRISAKAIADPDREPTISKSYVITVAQSGHKSIDLKLEEPPSP